MESKHLNEIVVENVGVVHKKEKPKRVHNEYFQTVSLGHRKSCPSCQMKLEPGEHIWSWGEYVRVHRRTVDYFCKSCFPSYILPRLFDHMRDCGCSFALNVQTNFNEQKPEWLKME